MEVWQISDQTYGRARGGYFPTPHLTLSLELEALEFTFLLFCQDLITSDFVCDVTLPYLGKRHALENSGALEVSRTPLTLASGSHLIGAPGEGQPVGG